MGEAGSPLSNISVYFLFELCRVSNRIPKKIWAKDMPEMASGHSPQVRRKNNPMNILLVDPPGKNKGFNTGLGYLAALLNKEHRVFVLDLNNVEIGLCGDPNPDLTEDEIRLHIYEACNDFDPDIVGISIKTFTAKTSQSIWTIVKEKKKDIVTIAGGPHITLDGIGYVKDSGIDFAIAGEGESSLPAFCDSLQTGRDLTSVSGLIYRRDGKTLKNSIAPAYSGLDELPFPDYTIFSSVKLNGNVLRQYPLLTSRGCPFSCSYCSMPLIMGRKWRSHSPDHVIRELVRAKELYGSDCFTVVDDCFTLDLNRVEDISDRLISSKLDMRWNSQNGIRADRITKNLAQKMKQSGCYHVWIGIESADPQVFRAINKGEKLDSISKGINVLKKAGIRVGGFFIVGLPYSTKEADLKSVAFVKESKIDAWWFNFVPYPFTVAWDWVKKNARVLRSPEGVLQYGSSDIKWVFETDNYSEAERIETYKAIHIKMGYFDRLFNPSLSQVKNLPRLLHDVLKIQPFAIFSFLVFIPIYNLKLVFRKLRFAYQNKKSQTTRPLSGYIEIDESPDFRSKAL
jgi:radical SAM superfamily enzyme YgiQ (UPF0313 family)